MAADRGKWKNDRHVPYYSKVSLAAADDESIEYIKNDPDKGLGVAGRSGWIINEGPGDITVEIFDGVYWSDPIDVYAGEGFTIEHEDDTWVEQVKVTAVNTGATYRLSMCRGTEGT